MTIVIMIWYFFSPSVHIHVGEGSPGPPSSTAKQLQHLLPDGRRSLCRGEQRTLPQQRSGSQVPELLLPPKGLVLDFKEMCLCSIYALESLRNCELRALLVFHF